MDKSKWYILLITFFNIGLIPNLIAQEEFEIEFGEIPIDDLKMQRFEADTNASALILYDYGNAFFNKYLEIEYKRQRRVKILRKSGYDWATCRIIYYHTKYPEKILDIEGYTTYFNENGEVIKTELKREDIFDEKLTEYTSVKSFTLPALQPGCVIEYRYTIKSDYVLNFPREWYFQYSEPVRWSEFKTEVPSTIQFAIYKQETVPFFINKQESFTGYYSDKYISGVELMLDGFRKRMVIREIPALRPESYMTSLDDYRAKIIYQMAKYKLPSSPEQKILDSWEEVGKELMADEDFGKQLKGCDIIEEKVNELVSPVADPDQKLSVIYDFVKNSFNWDEVYSINTGDLEKIFQQKKGNSGNINLLLTTMLKLAGIESYPVLISTRKHGTIFLDYPVLMQFNHLLVYANTGKNEYILDATDRLRPPQLLSEEALNDNGLMILDKSIEWVKINPVGKNLSVKLASVLIKNDGSVNGIMRLTYEDYAALNARREIENYKEDNFLKTVLNTDKMGLAASSIQITNLKDLEKQVIIDAKIASTQYAQVVGNSIYINPYFLGRLENNPFKLEKRSFPVNYAYKYDSYYKVNITLPSGFLLKEYPQTIITTIPDKSAGYERTVEVADNMLTFSTRFFVDRITFKPEEYGDLKKLYEQIIALESQQVVLQKQNN